MRYSVNARNVIGIISVVFQHRSANLVRYHVANFQYVKGYIGCNKKQNKKTKTKKNKKNNKNNVAITHFFLYKNQVYKNHRGSNSQKLRTSEESRRGSIFRHPKNDSFKSSKQLKMITRVMIFLLMTFFSLNSHVRNRFSREIIWKCVQPHLFAVPTPLKCGFKCGLRFGDPITPPLESNFSPPKVNLSVCTLFL